MIRFISIDFTRPDKHLITNYDALGYYMYLPATFIYHDISQFEWLAEVDKKYNVVGGDWQFQISRQENGNYVTKYLGGVAILQIPFFAIAHVYALLTDYPADGFSMPYQVSLSFGPLVYFILVLFLLRRILLKYYDDEVVALTLFLVFIASNAINYIAIEAGHSHGYILIMYALIIWLSIKWHERPTKKYALFIGLVIGLATIMRPTELIIFLVPLLWNTHSSVMAKEKWALVRSNRNHVYIAIVGALIGALPQIIYWLYVTGSPIYVIGSKWYFLNPYFRVIFGWQKGWFIYTPIAIFFVLGFFFMKSRPFQKSVIWFCLINIWIVISWSVWRYGGSYSTRALVQSYPIFALALGGFITWVFASRWKIPFYVLAVYLTAVNLFQVWQYHEGILRHDEMNRAYYQAVYLDANPNPLDMSMLDGGQKIRFNSDSTTFMKNVVPRTEIKSREVFSRIDVKENQWFDVKIDLRIIRGFWRGFIVISFKNEAGEEIERQKFRTFNYLTKSSLVNSYHMQVEAPKGAANLELSLGGGKDIAGEVRSLVIKRMNG